MLVKIFHNSHLYFCQFAIGYQNAGGGCGALRNLVGALPHARGLQSVPQGPPVPQRVVPLLLSHLPLSQQRGQPYPLQLHVHQVPAGLHQALHVPR